jgi:hypothetical protein
MEINGVSSTTTTRASPLGSPQNTNDADERPATLEKLRTSGGGKHAHISRHAKFLTNLQDLEKTDPAKAKATLTDLANRIRADAQQSGDSRHLAFADRLDKAAATGDLSDLFPPKNDANRQSPTNGYSQYAAVATAPPPALL